MASGGNCAQGAASAVFGKFTTNAIAGWGSGTSGVIARGVATMVAGGDGKQSWIYAHLAPDSIQVYQSQVVLQGDYIGDYASPANGNVTGPHLHLELRNNNGTSVLNQGNVNPIPGGRMTSDIDPYRVLTTNNGTQARPHNGTDWVGGR